MSSYDMRFGTRASLTALLGNSFSSQLYCNLDVFPNFWTSRFEIPFEKVEVIDLCEGFRDWAFGLRTWGSQKCQD